MLRLTVYASITSLALGTKISTGLSAQPINTSRGVSVTAEGAGNRSTNQQAVGAVNRSTNQQAVGAVNQSTKQPASKKASLVIGSFESLQNLKLDNIN